MTMSLKNLRNMQKKQTDRQERQPLTTAIPNKGFSGFRAVSPASNFVSVDSDALRNHLLGIAATVRHLQISSNILGITK